MLSILVWVPFFPHCIGWMGWIQLMSMETQAGEGFHASRNMNKSLFIQVQHGELMNLLFSFLIETW